MINSPSVAIVAEAPASRAIALPVSKATASPASATKGIAIKTDSSYPASHPGKSGRAERCSPTGIVKMPDR